MLMDGVPFGGRYNVHKLNLKGKMMRLSYCRFMKMISDDDLRNISFSNNTWNNKVIIFLTTRSTMYIRWMMIVTFKTSFNEMES